MKALGHRIPHDSALAWESVWWMIGGLVFVLCSRSAAAMARESGCQWLSGMLTWLSMAGVAAILFSMVIRGRATRHQIPFRRMVDPRIDDPEIKGTPCAFRGFHVIWSPDAQQWVATGDAFPWLSHRADRPEDAIAGIVVLQRAAAMDALARRDES